MQVSKINISKGLMREIRLTANLVSEIAGKDIECEGLILSDYGNDYAKFSHLPEQDATHSSCRTYEMEKIFGECYKKNQRVLGIWHSHGSFGVFHSDFDDAHVNSTIVPMAERYNKMLMEKPHYPSKNTLDDVMISIVVNSKEECYAEEFCKGEGKQVRLNIEEDCRRIDEESLIKSIGLNVRHSGLFLNQYPNYETVLKKYEGKLRKELNSSRIQKITQTQNLDSILKIITGKSSWEWEDRMREFETEYSRLRNAQNIHSHIRDIEDRIDSNSYLIRNHKRIYSDMKHKLSELKYRSWFKSVRNQRYHVKKQKLSHHSREPGAACYHQIRN